MSRVFNPLAFTALLVFLPFHARAEVPNVVTDIPPVHALAAQVMGGLGEPELLVQSGASPHHVTLRPSQAAAIEDANLVLWIGPELTPWLDETLDTLASEAEQVELLHLDATERLPFREMDDFEHGDHGHDADSGTDDDHADHGHDHHGDTDPHAWLDPDNAMLWLGVIADHLSKLDAGNAETYRQNAQDAQARLKSLAADLDRRMAEVEPPRLIVLHDAFAYFENRFDIEVSGAVSLGDAADPGPAHVARLQDRIRDLGVTCALAEPQSSTQLLQTVVEGQDVNVVTADASGTTLAAGPELYTELLGGIADAIEGCNAK